MTPEEREADLRAAFSDRDTPTLIRELLGYARMDPNSASFGMPHETVGCFACEHNTPRKDTFIKEETRNWRESWVIPLVEELGNRLAAFDSFDKNVKAARAAKADEEMRRRTVRSLDKSERELRADIEQLERDVSAAERRLAFLRDQLPAPTTGKRKIEI